MKKARSDSVPADEHLSDVFACTVAQIPYILAILSVPDYRYVYANPAHAEFMRAMDIAQPEDVLGKRASEVLPNWDDRLMPLCEEARASGQVRRIESFRCEFDGRVTYWDVVLIPCADPETRDVTSISTFCVEVTEYKQAEEEIQRHKELSARIVENTDDGIIAFDRDLRYTLWNRAMEAITGLSKSAALGQNIFDLFPFLKETGEDKFIDAALAGETGIAKDRPHVSRTGRRGFMESRYSPLRGETGEVVGGLIIIRDTTEQKEAADTLRESEEKFRELFNNANDPMYLSELGPYGMPLYFLAVNDAACSHLGYTRAEFARMTPKDLSMPEMHERLAIGTRQLLTEKRMTFPWTQIAKDGRRIPVEISAHVFDLKDKKVMLSVVRDITERVRMEEERLRLLEQQHEFYRRTIFAATDGKLAICDPGDIEASSGPSIASWKIARPEDLSGIRHAVADVATSDGMDASRVFDFVLCVGEAITNAFRHGGGGTLSLHRVNDGLLFVVTDKGPGIEALALPLVALKKGYSTAVSLGMGYKAMIAVADQVRLSTGPQGTTVAVEMKLRPVEQVVLGLNLPDWEKV